MNICMEMSSEICEDMTRCTERKTRNHLYIRFWKHLGREDACHIPWPSLLCGEDKRHGDLPKAACLEDVLRFHQRSTECAWIKAYSKIFRYLAVRPCIQVAAQKQRQKKCLSLRKMSSCSILSIKDCTWSCCLCNHLTIPHFHPFPGVGETGWTSWNCGARSQRRAWRRLGKGTGKDWLQGSEQTMVYVEHAFLCTFFFKDKDCRRIVTGFRHLCISIHLYLHIYIYTVCLKCLYRYIYMTWKLSERSMNGDEGRSPKELAKVQRKDASLTCGKVKHGGCESLSKVFLFGGVDQAANLIIYSNNSCMI